MIIKTVDEMIQDIQQNIYRLDIAIGSVNRNYALGELKRIEYRHLLMRYNSEKFAYEHCLEMAESLKHSQEVEEIRQAFIEPTDKEKAQQFFDSMSQGSIPSK